MTTHGLRLNIAAARDRRIMLNISTRVVAGELGLAEAAYRRVEAGLVDEHLTLAHLTRLAACLGMKAFDLLTAGPDGVAPTSVTGTEPVPSVDVASAGARGLDVAAEDSPAIRDATEEQELLVGRLGPMLLAVGRAVPIATLAAILETNSQAIASALERLREQLAPGGLVVSIGKPGATLVPAHSKPGGAAVRQLLRQAERRSAVNASCGRLLHRLARGESLPPSPKQAERQQLSILMSAAWIQAPPGRSGTANAMALHPDVVFSLILEDEEPTEKATASMWRVPDQQVRFTWLDPQPPGGETS